MRAILAVIAVCTLAVSTSSAGTLFGGAIPGDTTDDGGAFGTFLCSDTAGVEKYCAEQQRVSPAEGGKFHTVCINDFTYYPPIITPREGDVVAWINVEKCADPKGGPVNVAEGLFTDVLGVGCDTHHEVVTVPDETAIDKDDTLNARLCSRFPSILPKPGAPAIPNLAIDPLACPGHADTTDNHVPIIENLAPQSEGVITETNVFCHKFAHASLQHYTCLTNPAHTAVLNGGILVLPAQAPELPDLPQQPQL